MQHDFALIHHDPSRAVSSPIMVSENQLWVMDKIWDEFFFCFENDMHAC